MRDRVRGSGFFWTLDWSLRLRIGAGARPFLTDTET